MKKSFDKLFCMRLFFLWFFVLLTAAAQSQDTVVVKDENQMVSLANRAQFVEDTNGVFSIQNFLQPRTTIPFQEVNNQVINFGITPSVFWIKAILRNETGKDLLLAVDNSAISDIQVYETVGNQEEKQ